MSNVIAQPIRKAKIPHLGIAAQYKFYTPNHAFILYLPLTYKFFCIILGGCVDIWHSYVPSSSFMADSIFSLQLFGY